MSYRTRYQSQRLSPSRNYEILGKDGVVRLLGVVKSDFGLAVYGSWEAPS